MNLSMPGENPAEIAVLPGPTAAVAARANSDGEGVTVAAVVASGFSPQAMTSLRYRAQRWAGHS